MYPSSPNLARTEILFPLSPRDLVRLCLLLLTVACAIVALHVSLPHRTVSTLKIMGLTPIVPVPCAIRLGLSLGLCNAKTHK